MKILGRSAIAVALAVVLAVGIAVFLFSKMVGSFTSAVQDKYYEYEAMPLNQASAVYFPIPDDAENRKKCTIGDINYMNDTLATAAHCVTGEQVAYDERGKRIGEVEINKQNDTAIIHPDDKRSIGENNITNNAIDYNPTPGKQVCMQGAVTENEVCGEIKAINSGGEIIIHADMAGKQGDSGAPVYSEQGIIGLYSGVYTNDETGEITSAYAQILFR